MTNKFFFMSALTATLHGRPITTLSTISALDSQNLTARSLDMIQQGAASMVQEAGVEFTDLVINNIFFLGEMTEEEFTGGTSLAKLQQSTEAEAQETDLVAEGFDDRANLIGTSSDLSELDAYAVEATLVDDVTTADVTPND